MKSITKNEKCENLIEENFAKNVFTKDKMQKFLKKQTYENFLNTIYNGNELDDEAHEEIANAMKEWAMENGVTHYAHWFQPLNGKTAEKHDSFLEISSSGDFITCLSKNELIKSEPDASSFPSGGLRETFEARGYTFWDMTSPVFIKGHTLFIPSLFYSYNGDVLDEKTPLLKSEEALSKYAIKILKLLGHEDIKKVIVNVGAEQEYFLIDKDLFEKRKDLVLTGRTLFGRHAPKSQEIDSNYFKVINERIEKFMLELDIELWKLGIPAKTKHNEVAPMQHELASIYTEANVASDNNHLVTEMMKKVALRHNLVCLLHEKPFEGINGSGKHNNWSITTDTGINLFSPGKNPKENIEFLLSFAILIRGVDKYSELIRAAASCVSNDLRLGGNEAPPVIISIFIGDYLFDIIKSLANEQDNVNKNISNDSKKKNKKLEMNLKVSSIKKFMKDTEDRNRTSPFAFTGNKFEFRMLGASSSIAQINTILNTIMIEGLDYAYTKLKNSNDVVNDTYLLVSDIIRKHERIIFNGDGYSKEWFDEAKKRKLPIINNTQEALEVYASEKNIDLFTHYEILSRREIFSKKEVMKEDYIMNVLLEARVMTEMVDTEIIPSVLRYEIELSNSILSVKQADRRIKPKMQMDLLNELNEKLNIVNFHNSGLKEMIEVKDELPEYYAKRVIPKMNELRRVVDDLESKVDKDVWPMPAYYDLLYNV